MTDRRSWIALAGGALAAPVLAAPGERAASRGTTLLTLTGAIQRSNRPALDGALDQLMVKHKLAFDRGYALDAAAIGALPKVTIKPTLEYDSKPHTLSGPLLSDVVVTAGVKAGDAVQLTLRAIDGYAVGLSLADARKYRFIVATHLDGAPLPLGGLGPLWAVYDADRFPDMAAKPIGERFALCPWGLYHTEIKPA